MEYQRYSTKAYNMHLIKTDKFKTITIRILFRRLIKREEITIRSFIHPLLLLTSKKYPSPRLLTKKMESLYGPIITASENRLGKYTFTSFNMTMINDKYTQSNLNKESIDYFKEIVFNPDVDSDGFNIKSFNIVKNEVTARLKSIKDNPDYYSMVRMLEKLDPKSPLSYRNGYLEDIENIDTLKVFEYYKSMLHSDLIDVFVLGDMDFADMRSLITDMIPINTVKKQEEDIYIEHNSFAKRLRKAADVENLLQAKLVIGCKIEKLTPFENNYVLPLFSAIFGGPGYSKLFDSVREKNSLAYYVSSNYRHADRLLTIRSGINKESYNKALKLIKVEFDNMAKGNISDDELAKAKEDRLSVARSIEDNPILIINNYLWQLLYQQDDIETYKKKIMTVTVDDIKRISKKIHMDTVYLLHGGDDNEANQD